MDIKLMSKNVSELFYDCIFAEEELVNGRPTSPLTTIRTDDPNLLRKFSVGFSTNRLNKNKRQILALIDLLPEIEKGTDLDSLNYDQEGNKWCNDTKTLDQLIMMGMACNAITVMTIEGQDLILVNRNKKDDELEVTGIAPENLPESETLPAQQNEIDEKALEQMGKEKILEKFAIHSTKVQQTSSKCTWSCVR